MILPLTEVGGSWYVVINWSPSMDAGELLTLRPLNDKEVAWLEPRLEDAVMECWARLFPNDNVIVSGADPPEE